MSDVFLYEKVYCRKRAFFSLKGKSTRQKLVIKISAPYLVDESMVNFKFDPGTAVCTIEFDGLPESLVEKVYGADSVQALALAADIDPYLRGMRKKYDFYWATGESYFDD